MKIDILDEGAFASALVHIEPGEEFVSEAGYMFRASGNVDIDVTTRPRGSKGGILQGIKRLIGGDSLFFSTYRTTDNQPGEVGLAPTFQGEVKVIGVDREAGWVVAGGAYMASTSGLSLDTKFQGMRGFLSGESLFFMHVTGGPGAVLVSAFGRIVELNVTDEMTIDTGHLVAFQDTLDYTISKAGRSWIQSFFSGEGLVMNITGRGKVWVQSHNPAEYGRALGPLLPAREA